MVAGWTNLPFMRGDSFVSPLLAMTFPGTLLSVTLKHNRYDGGEVLGQKEERRRAGSLPKSRQSPAAFPATPPGLFLFQLLDALAHVLKLLREEIRA